MPICISQDTFTFQFHFLFLLYFFVPPSFKFLSRQNICFVSFSELVTDGLRLIFIKNKKTLGSQSGQSIVLSFKLFFFLEIEVKFPQ